jgi:hypothetical protein
MLLMAPVEAGVKVFSSSKGGACGSVDLLATVAAAEQE